MSSLPNPPPRARSSDPAAPVRFVEGGGTDYERRLLEAAERLLPPPASVDRVSAALRAAALAGPSLDQAVAQHARSPSTSAATGLVKPGALGILAVGIIGLVVAGRGSLVTDERLPSEVRAIEHIQTLLAWGETEPARRALADYRQRFPKGELTLEADLLNVDIALARGEPEEARRLAQALLERPAASRYRERLNALLEAGSKRGPR